MGGAAQSSHTDCNIGEAVRYSYYNAKTGAISDFRFSGSEKNAKLNTPAEHVAIAGRLDPLSQRVDVETKEVVDWQPPPPDNNHEWNAERRRYVKKGDVIAAERRDRHARTRIAELEGRQQRALREYTLGDSAAIDRLRAIDDEIKTLRSDLIIEQERA